MINKRLNYNCILLYNNKLITNVQTVHLYLKTFEDITIKIAIQVSKTYEWGLRCYFFTKNN